MTARSIFTFVDETVDGIRELIEREREELVGGTHAERLETVNLILEGAPITRARASERLRYELAGEHTAAVVWTEDEGGGQSALESAADALARAAGARRAFTVVASTRALWAWFAAPRARRRSSRRRRSGSRSARPRAAWRASAARTSTRSRPSG